MTPAARVQAAIEILDTIIVAARGQGAPADRLVADWFRTRRFAGSADRRAVRALVFAAVRACGEVPASGRAPMPGWLAEALASSGIDAAGQQALLTRAPLDIRVNNLKADRATLALPVAAAATVAPQGLRLPSGTQVEAWPAWRDGLIEVQDTGSQLLCEAVSAAPGEAVIDLCAGAGGKTLALAAAMAGRGRLIACDIDRARLARLHPRAARAGAGLIETRLLDPEREALALADWAGRADAVLVDAPCSGTGTLRRNPEARWRLSPAAIDRLCAVQARLLDIAAGLVRPGGRLVFATCSLLDAEGCAQVSGFLAAHRGWRAAPHALPAGRAQGAGWRLTPGADGTDGFFVARLERL